MGAAAPASGQSGGTGSAGAGCTAPGRPRGGAAGSGVGDRDLNNLQHS